MVRRAAYAYVALMVVSALLSGAALLGAVTYYHREQAAQQRQDAQVAASQKAQDAKAAAAQHAQAQAFERRLCATLLPLESLAQLKPPAGNPVANPSRAFEQELARKLAPLAELGPDVGCRP